MRSPTWDISPSPKFAGTAARAGAKSRASFPVRVLRIMALASSAAASLPLNAACLETWEILAAKTLS